MPDIEWKESRHSNGKLRWRASYKNEQRHGIANLWDQNGKMTYEVFRRNGQLHGIEKSWTDEKLKHISYYLYNEIVTKDEYHKHELIEKLAGLEI